MPQSKSQPLGIDLVFVASMNLGLIIDEGPKLGSLTIPSVVLVDTVAWDSSIQWAGGNHEDTIIPIYLH